MEKLLLPIDGSARSLRSVELVKELFPPDKVEVTLLTVVENYDSVLSQYELEQRNLILPFLAFVHLACIMIWLA